MRKRIRVIALVVALLAAASLAGATGFIVYRRAMLPWRVIQGFTVERKWLVSSIHFVHADQGVATVLCPLDDGGGWSGAYEITVATLESTTLTRYGGVELTDWDWSSGSGRVVRQWNWRQIELEDPVSLERTVLLPSQRNERLALAISRGEDVIATVTSPGTAVVLRRSRTGELLRSLEIPEAQRGSNAIVLEFSPKSDFIRLQTRGNLWLESIWSIAEGRLICTIDVEAPALGFNDTGEVLVRMPSAHGFIVSAFLPGGRDEVLAISCADAVVSASGERLAVVSTTDSPPISVISTHKGELIRKIPKRPGNPIKLALSPSGDKLAIAYDDGRIEVWEIP